MQEKLDDYGDFPVPFVWVIDPRTQRGYTYSLEGGFNMQPGVRATNPDIELAIEPLFEYGPRRWFTITACHLFSGDNLSTRPVCSA
jgi:hypothetical protein